MDGGSTAGELVAGKTRAHLWRALRYRLLYCSRTLFYILVHKRFYFAFLSCHVQVNPIVSKAILILYPAQSTSSPREDRIKEMRGTIDLSRGGLGEHYK